MPANGIDVSSYQGKMSLTTDLEGLDFVIAKCTEGWSVADPTYNYYQTQARALKLHFGAYHYLHAESLDGKQEALWFMRHAALQSGDSIWIDYETYGTKPAVDLGQLALFVETVKSVAPIMRVGLYANLTGYARIGRLGIDNICGAFWLALPTGEAETPDKPLNPYGLTWTIHQYETLANVDRDYSRITAEQLNAMFAWC